MKKKWIGRNGAHSLSVEERFWEKVDRRSENECWNWLASQWRYGEFKYNGNKWRAHRFSYYIYFGDIPEGLYILHKCDNTICVNPSHLYLGTQFDNMRDMKIRGRERYSVGEERKNSKLTNKEVFEIRKFYREGQYNQRELGEIYNTTRTNISNIVLGLSWKHLL